MAETARRRGRNREKRTVSTLRQLPWRDCSYLDLPTEPLDAEGVHRIHDAAMRILEEIGIDFLNEEARAILKKAGCRVTAGEARVRMDREFVKACVDQAPGAFTITPRNPDHRIPIGAGHVTFGSVGSPPNFMDLDQGRRPGTRETFQILVKLIQIFNCLHFSSGYPVEPMDLHAKVRHLHAYEDLLTLTDKVIMTYSLGPERVEDTLEMARIAAGLSHEEFDSQPRLMTNINSSSPLKHDWPMLDGAMRFARRGQPVVVAPFTLAGAMAPITLAGAIAQQTAEALAAVALLQVIRPGTPVVMGAFTTNVDMKTGAPAFGTPEYMRAMQMSGQMARFYGLPWRGSNANAANFPDAQAMWESVQSLWGVTSGHANMVMHAAGWLEGGLTASPEKFVLDCETLQQVIAYNQPIGVEVDDLALETIAEVGPHGHFLGTAHTQARYQTEFYQPFLSDWSNYENWFEAGAATAHERANRLWKTLIAEYAPPPMDPAIREELAAFVARRVEEGGAPTDF